MLLLILEISDVFQNNKQKFQERKRNIFNVEEVI